MLFLLSSCSSINSEHSNNGNNNYTTLDLYNCIANDSCSRFGKGFSYNENISFIENTELIKAQIAKVYFSSPDIKKPYNNKTAFDKILNKFRELDIEIINQNEEKQFIFAKAKPEITQNILGLEWKQVNMIIVHLEESLSSNNMNIYTLVQPMEKMPLSEVFTDSEITDESKKFKHYLVTTINNLL